MPKRYQMVSGTTQQFVANLEKQFPNEKEVISKWMNLVDVRIVLVLEE